MEKVSEILTRLVGAKKCTDCGKDFIPNAEAPKSWQNLIRQCDECTLIALRKSDQEIRQRAQFEAEECFKRDWLKICPPIFHDTDPAKLPCQSAYKEVMQWNFGAHGLVLHGPSGKGKSRCAWLVIQRERNSRRSFMVLDSMAGLKYASKFNRGADEVEAWIEELIATDLLFMDDIFKNKLTDSFEGVIFTLIDQRIQGCKPVILTSNDTGKTLASRMTEDRAEPLIRRIRDHGTKINFY